MPKRPRDDSTGAVGNLGTRFHRQHSGMTVDTAFRYRNEHRATDFAVLLIQPRERSQQDDIRRRPVPLRSLQRQLPPVGRNDVRTKLQVFVTGR